MKQKLSFRYRVLLFLAVLAFILLYLSRGEVDNYLVKSNLAIGKNSNTERPNNFDSRKTQTKYSKPLMGQSCPSRHFVTGIEANGKIKCGAISASVLSPSVLEKECYSHGFIEDGFCECDEGWSGPHCERQKTPPSEDTPPDNDFDNVPASLDCDDDDDLVYPGAPDAVDGKDNDCDGEIDEGY